ncbi:MAG TPA: peptidoglycan DD-metalloendopeptidase family protein [Gammaproteobacteria bacterium]|nr:peptidoglycan DD-metalloendopeptidase family protein [Gammaproteobacteria bacterium]
MKHLVLMLLGLLPLCAEAAPLPADTPVPGGVAVLQLPDGAARPVVHMGVQRIMVVQNDHHWYALAGIPLGTAPGEHSLTLENPDGPPLELKFQVDAKTYPVQRLTIENPHMVNPTPEELARITREKAHLDQVLDTWTPRPEPGLAFTWPADGPQSSGFGLQRVLNGEPRSPHSGIDIAAATGTPVRAPESGVVADVGDYYFCGNTLTINLGQGLYSVYCHLSRIDVKPGTQVTRGEVVGAIGATGRTTGPNLHWTVRLNGTPVNPHEFLPQTATDTSSKTQ